MFLGALIMIIVVVIIGLILNLLMDTYLAIIIACLIFLAWYMFNQKEATVGLFRSNLLAYNKAILKGADKETAINSMIISR